MDGWLGGRGGAEVVGAEVCLDMQIILSNVEKRGNRRHLR